MKISFLANAVNANFPIDIANRQFQKYMKEDTEKSYMNQEELTAYKTKLLNIKDPLDHPTTREYPACPVYIYDDIDNDEIRFYDFEAQKQLPFQVLENETCLEPIDLVEMVGEMKKLEII